MMLSLSIYLFILMLKLIKSILVIQNIILYLYNPYISQSISLGVAGDRKRYLPNSSDISLNGKLFKQLRQFSAASFFLNRTNTWPFCLPRAPRTDTTSPNLEKSVRTFFSEISPSSLRKERQKYPNISISTFLLNLTNPFLPGATPISGAVMRWCIMGGGGPDMLSGGPSTCCWEWWDRRCWDVGGGPANRSPGGPQDASLLQDRSRRFFCSEQESC